MTIYLMILAVLMLMVGCDNGDPKSPVDNQPAQDDTMVAGDEPADTDTTTENTVVADDTEPDGKPDLDVPATCGNGVIDSGEICDGGSVYCGDLDEKWAFGTAYCNDICSGYNTYECQEPYADDDDTEQPDADTTPAWVTDQTFAGLEWSPRTNTSMGWQEAMDYCEAMGARLPNINELRKIIINCPGSTYGGACQVSDPDCLHSKDCWSEDCSCDGTAASYSALGDGKDLWLWSSSPLAGYYGFAWSVGFARGIVNTNCNDGDSRGQQFVHARCVR